MITSINPRKHLVIANSRIITADIISIQENINNKLDITFRNGRTYSYNKPNVKLLYSPRKLLPVDYKIHHNGKELFNISEIYEFKDFFTTVWVVFFSDGSFRSYHVSDLEITKSCLTSPVAKNVFNYFKDTADIIGLKSDDGANLLIKQYEKIEMIDENTALATYLEPQKHTARKYNTAAPIFPFGCNSSQFNAVKNALENQISIIQGPPGTGKTQTILNIIANLIIAGKTILVVSNNNSATQNIYEKLSRPEYNMNFFVAPLGNKENKDNFISSQKKVYPNLINWKDDSVKSSENKALLVNQSKELLDTFRIQEKLALLNQEYNSICTEYKHFEQYLVETNEGILNTPTHRNLLSKKVLKLWHESQYFADSNKNLSLFYKLKSWLVYGISDWNFYKQDISAIISAMQLLYYKSRINEISTEISQLQTQLNNRKFDNLLSDFTNLSMRYLKHSLYEKYSSIGIPTFFSIDDLWMKPETFLNEYPLVLSTTFSARNCLNKDTVFDYLIMDEASQVDVATGALAISCAKNIVIVGDTKQLPNVITEKDRITADTLFDRYNISSNYKFSSNSFLKSICEVLPYVPQTMLREHYRCHPKIINFCNQKFYNNELIIMTSDNGEENVLSAMRTSMGNHRRGHVNQRQIDSIWQEILPSLTYEDNEIGIIAPYNDQVNALKRQLNNSDIDIATVHKFQGREKDAIILTTVDNEITDFTDDPYLLNVAISRAKKHLSVLLNGNNNENKNILDLVDYIQYNNFEIHESKIYSVFDMLYSQYTQSRQEFLKGKKQISDYDSENIMYNVIKDILDSMNINTLDVICHIPLNMIIRDVYLLDENEIRYAMNSSTHVDFLIYNKLTKKIVLIIEVDGYNFHREGTAQAERDIMKNKILEKYDIPYIRFSTTGSGEKEKITEFLNNYCREEI